MDISFYFGADKIPLQVENGLITGERPYYTIISRGLNMLPQWTNSRWERVASKLDLIITGASETDNETILDSCYGLDVLTVADTIRAIRIFLINNANDIALSILANHDSDFSISSIDSCFLKEGHTSSVWKTTLTFEDQQQITFALNVARDKLANPELWNSSVLMEQLQNHKPDLPISNVLLKSKIALTDIGYEVVVVANQWIPDSKELHLVSDIESGEQYFFAIDEFVLGDDKKCEITQLKGTSFSKSESENLWSQIKKFEEEAAFYDPEANKMILPKIEINEGDIVWDSIRISVVALN